MRQDTLKVTQARQRTEQNQIEYYTVRWDAKGRITGKPYRATSGIMTNRAKAEKFAADKPNAELVIDYCAMFL